MSEQPVTPTSPSDIVRLLINDPSGSVFDDGEILGFLALEGEVVKLAAAQAVDTIADNEALVSKVIKDGNLSTDGAKVAAELRKRATSLRAQHAQDLEDSDDSFYFGVVDLNDTCAHGELTGY